MGAVLTAVAILGGVATFFGAVLAVAHRTLHVEEDPRIDQVESMLPGTNCGACGQPGCRAFAEALVRGDVQPAQCTVSSPDGIEAIASFLGVSAGEAVRRVARLHCGGGRTAVRLLAEYRGPQTCRAAAAVAAGFRACPWGCLGFGDCERVCNFDAIVMSSERLPVVDPERCTACGDCVVECPLDLLTLEPVDQPLLVQCNSPLVGEAARAACAVACDACGRCVADAPAGALEMRDGLPRIVDPALATRQATFRCPTGAIQWVVGKQFASEVPTTRPAEAGSNRAAGAVKGRGQPAAAGRDHA